MKAIILVLLLIPTLTFAQLKDFLLKKEPNLQAWTKKADNTQTIEKLKSSGLLDDYYLDNDPSSNFHLIDFDADGLTDILFYGYIGGESKQIIFFRNNGTQYKKTLDVMGELVYVSDFKPYAPLSFALNQYGCCSSINDVFEQYIPVESGENFKYVLSNKIAFTKGLKFPTIFITPKFFETINPEYTLRAQPTINNQIIESSDYDLQGNILAVYPPGSIGTAIATETDSTGRVWYFSIMKNNIEPIKEILHEGYNNEQTYCSMGWISSRFIKEH